MQAFYKQFDHWRNRNIDTHFLHTVTNYVYHSLKTLGVGLIEDLDEEETKQHDQARKDYKEAKKLS